MSFLATACRLPKLNHAGRFPYVRTLVTVVISVTSPLLELWLHYFFVNEMRPERGSPFKCCFRRLACSYLKPQAWAAAFQFKYVSTWRQVTVSFGRQFLFLRKRRRGGPVNLAAEKSLRQSECWLSEHCRSLKRYAVNARSIRNYRQ